MAKQWKTDRIHRNSVGHSTVFLNVKEVFKPKEMKTDGKWNLLEGVKSTRNKNYVGKFEILFFLFFSCGL